MSILGEYHLLSKIELYCRHPVLDLLLEEVHNRCANYSLERNVLTRKYVMDLFLDPLEGKSVYKYVGFVEDSGFSPRMVLEDGCPKGDVDICCYRMCLIKNICYTAKKLDISCKYSKGDYVSFLDGKSMSYVYDIWNHLDMDGIFRLSIDIRSSRLGTLWHNHRLMREE